ncbi:hypothetical protein [Sulfurovum sp.]|uniref:hypothetical protein n=1 Tax=Sulfurovum sp. TaxID=1969726 RepID=UPI0025FCC834|nr:hypothetical protein [Sulfurovum sp.]
MQDREMVSEKKLAKLAKHVAKAFGIEKQEALEIIYEEWELVEELFAAHKKVKAVKEHFLTEVNYLYRIA